MKTLAEFSKRKERSPSPLSLQRALRLLHEIPLLARAINEAWGISRKANLADSAGFDKCLPHLDTCYVSSLWFANDAPRGTLVSSPLLAQCMR
ncbi:hypothetical protein TNCV_32651 [Trichonephila clavipes]|nr:hypothetical protein TNCV_32651 [Trichonephila clavipes]